jgi:hypothetical protein
MVVKQLLAVVAVVLLLMNGYLVFFQNGNNGIWQSNQDDGEGATLDDLKVVVPPYKLGDDALYEYLVFAEMYWKDYESGNWSDYRLTINGNMRYTYNANPVERNDGFFLKHNTLDFDMLTDASLEVYVASSDAEPITIGGSIHGDHHEYLDLKEKRPVETYTKADIALDRLPRINTGINYKAVMDSYINPKRPVDIPLGDQIYGGGKQIALKDNGTVLKSEYYSLYNLTLSTYYNWTADRAMMFKSYKALHLNITSQMFGDFLDYNEQFWIAQDLPFFVKRYTKMNQTWTDENGTLFFIIETNHTLQDRGYTAGTADIPWGSCNGEHWAERAPSGEFKSYKYLPPAGNGYSASSFDFKTDDADQFARQNSPGLQAFLNKFDDQGNSPTMIYASYNASRNPLDVNGKAGSYRWNLTYGHWPTEDEQREARETHDWNFTYNVVLLKNVTKDLSKPLQNEYIETVQIEHDWGLRRDYAALPREALPSDGLTLAASENIMMKDPTVKAKLGDKNGKIDWGNYDTVYGIYLSGMGGQQNPGYQMLELMTGITMPSVDYGWSVTQGTVYESGSTFTASVDADNGQLVYVADIQGTALMALFP